MIIVMVMMKIIILLTYLSSSSPVGHKASISCLHSRRSWARYYVSQQERFNSDSSDVIVFIQLVFGHPPSRWGPFQYDFWNPLLVHAENKIII